jgi:phage host-nuclease inhibitor protein Gam
VSKSPKVKTRAANVPVPQSREELRDFIHRIGVAQRKIDRINCTLCDAIATAKVDAEREADPFVDEVAQLTEGARVYCEAHRDELTNDRKVKHFETGAGLIEWRFRPPSVRLKPGWTAERAIDLLKRLKLKKYVRVSETINKEALREAPVKDTHRVVEAFSIGSAGEEFIVTPLDAEIKGAAE